MTAKDYLAFFVEQIHSIAVAILIQFNAYTKNAPKLGASVTSLGA